MDGSLHGCTWVCTLGAITHTWIIADSNLLMIESAMELQAAWSQMWRRQCKQHLFTDEAPFLCRRGIIADDNLLTV